jgi:uncharacterized protein YlxW (UPF0749 family)
MRKKKEPRVVPKRNERFTPPVHVGHLVWRHILYVEKQPKNNLAKHTNRSLATVSRQLRMPSMQTNVLFEFCHVLKRNFFEDLADALPVEYSKKAAEKQQHLQKLENDLVKLQEENVLLKAENKKLNERVDLLLNKL